VQVVKPIAHFLLLTWLAAILLPAAAQSQRPGGRQQGAGPRVGEPAPDFKLQTKDGQREVQLSSFKGQRPVVLVFGSFT